MIIWHNDPFSASYIVYLSLYTGAVAWLLDETNSFDEILVNDGAHLILNGNSTINNIIGDGRSMMHLAPYTFVVLANNMTTHCFIYEEAGLNLTANSTVIGEYLYVKGRLDINPNAVVSVEKPATVHLVTQNITVSELTVKKDALMSVKSSDQATFNLSLTKLEVHGEFLAGPTDFFDITEFIVGTSGNVELDPVDEDEYLGQNIEINGTVTFGHAVSFKRPCENFMIDLGKLSWNVTASTNITLECKQVLINGPFTPGAVTFGEGIEEFNVGNSGTFTFTAHGTVFMNGISVAGTMNVQNYAKFESKNETSGIIIYFIIHSPNGKVYLNSDNGTGYDSNGTETNVNCSVLPVENLIVDGVFSAKTLDIANGMDSLHIGNRGSFSFTLRSDLRVNTVQVSGSMTSTTPITLRGNKLEKTDKFTIGSQGVVKFDNDVLSNKSWSGSSQLGIRIMEVSGTFHAGRMINRVAKNSGWDSLSVLTGGAFYFEPEYDFIVDYVSLNGNFRAYKPINILTKRSEQDLRINVGSTGNVRFDSLVTSGWTGVSNVTAYTLQTSTSSYFNTGDTKFDLKQMTIHGTLDAFPSVDISALNFEVSTTGVVNFDSPNCTVVRMETIDINGIFSTRTLDITDGVQSLRIGDHGQVTFRPCSEFGIHEIYVNGKLTSASPITLKGYKTEKTGIFTIDTHGVVKFDNDVLSTRSWSGSSQLGVHNMKIVGTLHAGRMINRVAENSGWDSLSVLTGGAFYFEPEYDFIVDYVSLNGNFRAYKPINVFTKRSEQDLMIHIGSTGDVKFDSLVSTGWTGVSNVTAHTLQTSTSSYFNTGDTKFDLKRMIIGGTLVSFPSVNISAPSFEVTTTGNVTLDSPNCTVVRMETIYVDGIFSARTLDITNGVQSLYIDDHGQVTFKPCSEFGIHDIYVNGKMTSATPITLKGYKIEKVHNFTIDTQGVVKFDNDVLSSRSWSGSSQLGIHSMEVSGTFHAGRMINRVAINGGWDSLSVLTGGVFYFEPDDEFIVDYVSLNGNFRTYTPIKILTKRSEQDLKIYVGSTGDVRFDYLITSGWTGLSNITAHTLQTSTGSYFSAGNTKFDLKRMIIGGTLLAYPSKDINATYFEVTGTGLVDLSRTVDIDGQTMTVSGTLDVSYKHQPEDTNSGSMETKITYDYATLSGIFKAGSIHMESKTLSITGTMDVSGGGYLADKGPGE